jgi:hypothetical protein
MSWCVAVGIHKADLDAAIEPKTPTCGVWCSRLGGSIHPHAARLSIFPRPRRSTLTFLRPSITLRYAPRVISPKCMDLTIPWPAPPSAQESFNLICGASSQRRDGIGRRCVPKSWSLVFATFCLWPQCPLHLPPKFWATMSVLSLIRPTFTRVACWPGNSSIADRFDEIGAVERCCATKLSLSTALL